jgi:hypothetical protein
MTDNTPRNRGWKLLIEELKNLEPEDDEKKKGGVKTPPNIQSANAGDK